MPRWRMSLSRSPAGTCARGTMDSRHYWPIWQLTISRMRVFYREPAAVFWVYGFPLVMAMSLGTAFRDNPTEKISVDLIETTDEWNQLLEQGTIHQKRSNRKSKIENL